ncbi:hypothetical protein [Vibrio parahaemolyticus]|uniref:hypothetical protein n=1 Tax=Vibrio parahaemolyticus TaxID=670 RepID=UPI0027E4BC08|nr:hypothetical protein [Vibrio parahaemolyticus]WMN64953.1 hypothetical protein NI388_07405 [Vibrio parahaemolyticus]WMN75592.1 hypothetical protein NI386_15485 [Vibrio parahaemolyticus]
MSEELCSCKDEDREVKVKMTTYCGKCSEVIGKFAIKRPFKALGVTVLIAYGGSNFIDYAISDNRYPLGVESELLDACTSSSERLLKYTHYKNKKNICVCALQDTMNEISYIRFKIDDKAFSEAFSKNARACI